jgi:hypothetical protein
MKAMLSPMMYAKQDNAQFEHYPEAKLNQRHQHIKYTD